MTSVSRSSNFFPLTFSLWFHQRHTGDDGRQSTLLLSAHFERSSCMWQTAVGALRIVVRASHSQPCLRMHACCESGPCVFVVRACPSSSYLSERKVSRFSGSSGSMLNLDPLITSIGGSSAFRPVRQAQASVRVISLGPFASLS